ncbi:hypothetical protein AgCh_010178 [Apium graveolens]
MEDYNADIKFIRSNAHLVDEWILKEAIKGEEFYINQALFQIHSSAVVKKANIEPKKSMPSSSLAGVNSFRNVLLKTYDSPIKQSFINSDMLPKQSNLDLNTLFVSNISHLASAKDIWTFFKKWGDLKDIVLHEARDRYGRRIGFLKARTREVASNLIRVIAGKSVYAPQQPSDKLARWSALSPLVDSDSGVNICILEHVQFQQDEDNASDEVRHAVDEELSRLQSYDAVKYMILLGPSSNTLRF